MRLLTLCTGLALAVVCCTSPAQAAISITKSKDNTEGQTFSSGGVGGFSASGNKSVSFTSEDFGMHPTADIISIDVSISFTKLLGTYPGATFPFYNEIQMTFSKAGGGPSTTLIAAGSPITPYGANSFGGGLFQSPGFDGTVTFSSTATTRVNADQNVIPNTPGTSYRPASSEAASVPWDTFVGQSAIGTFTLNLADIDGGGDNSLDPLVFRSMTVTITAVPEPSSLAAVGLLALGGTFIRRRRS